MGSWETGVEVVVCGSWPRALSPSLVEVTVSLGNHVIGALFLTNPPAVHYSIYRRQTSRHDVLFADKGP